MSRPQSGFGKYFLRGKARASHMNYVGGPLFPYAVRTTKLRKALKFVELDNVTQAVIYRNNGDGTMSQVWLSLDCRPED